MSRYVHAALYMRVVRVLKALDYMIFTYLALDILDQSHGLYLGQPIIIHVHVAAEFTYCCLNVSFFIGLTLSQPRI